MENNNKDESNRFYSLSLIHGEGEESTVGNTTLVASSAINGVAKCLTIWLVDSGTPVAIYNHESGEGDRDEGASLFSETMTVELVRACAHYLNSERILTAKPVLLPLGGVEGSQDILKAITSSKIVEVAIVDEPNSDGSLTNGDKFINYRILNGSVDIVGIRQASVEQAALFGGEGLNVTGYSKSKYAINPVTGMPIVSQHYIPYVRVEKDKYLCSIPFYVESISLTFVG